MAKALPEEENLSDETEVDLSSLTCTICFERYDTPRKLPCCFHLFCEDCLFHYVRELRVKEELNEGVRCPVCRQVNLAPGSSQDTLEWVRSLSLDEDTIEKVKSLTGEGALKLCVSCKESKSVTPAAKFCIDCQESFCKHCSEICHRLKVVRNHTIIDFDSSQNGTREDQDTTRLMSDYMSCPRHPENVTTLLCKDDGGLCCLSCAFEDNLKGREIVEIEKHATEEQNGKEADELMQRLDHLAALIEAILASKKAAEADNKANSEKISTEVREMRAKMNALFDNLEENISQQCKALTKKYTLDAQQDSEKLSETIKSIKTTRSVLKKTNLQGSTLLLYVILCQLKRKLVEYENTVLDIKAGCKKSGFELEIQEILSACLAVGPNDTELLAMITETEDMLSLPDYSERHLLKHCTIVEAGKHTLQVQDAKLVLSYTGLVGLPDGRIALVDNSNGFCCVVNDRKIVTGSCYVTQANNKLKNRATVKGWSLSQPFGVAYIKNETLVVSVPNLKKLFFISTSEELRIISEVNTSYKPLALRGLKNGELALSCYEPVAFRILRFSHSTNMLERVYLDRDRNGRLFKLFCFMAVDEERSHVLQSCLTEKKLYCFDFLGNPKFEYSHPDLQNNVGVDLDADGNIYLCDYLTSSIHILSPDGIAVRIFKVGPKPIAVAFMHNSSEFGIVNSSGDKCQLTMYKLRKEN